MKEDRGGKSVREREDTPGRTANGEARSVGRLGTLGQLFGLPGTLADSASIGMPSG